MLSALVLMYLQRVLWFYSIYKVSISHTTCTFIYFFGMGYHHVKLRSSDTYHVIFLGTDLRKINITISTARIFRHSCVKRLLAEHSYVVTKYTEYKNRKKTKSWKSIEKRITKYLIGLFCVTIAKARFALHARNFARVGNSR